MDYEKLKRYPNREIEILSEALSDRNKRREAAIEKARRGGKTATGDTITISGGGGE